MITLNEYQKQRFAERVVKRLFNTITNKNIAVYGFAFKKDTGDTRESAAITLVKFFLNENANVRIYDPKVSSTQIKCDITDDFSAEICTFNLTTVDRRVKICPDAYNAALNADAIVICTEWDEFKEIDYVRIFEGMNKPAFVFDGRCILNTQLLKKIGFQVEVIGKSIL